MRIFIFTWLLFSIANLHANLIHEAAANNDIKTIRANIALKDQPDEFGYRPIHHAARHGQFRALGVLVKSGANINSATENEGFTALHLVASYGHPGMVNFLLENGARINLRDKISSATSIQYAVFHGKLDTFRALVRYKKDEMSDEKCNLSLSDMHGRTVLHWAVMFCRPVMVAELLREELIQEVRDKPDIAGQTALQMALERRNTCILFPAYDATGLHTADVWNSIVKLFNKKLSSSRRPSIFQQSQQPKPQEEAQASLFAKASPDASLLATPGAAPKPKEYDEYNYLKAVLKGLEQEQTNAGASSVAAAFVPQQEDGWYVQGRGGKKVSAGQPASAPVAQEEEAEQESEVAAPEAPEEECAAAANPDIVKNKKKKKGGSPLHNALLSGTDDVSDLIDFDSVAKANADGDYPVHYAVRLKSKYLQDILSLSQSVVNKENKKGLRPLDEAQDAKTIDLLLQEGADYFLLDIEQKERIEALANREENKKFVNLRKCVMPAEPAATASSSSDTIDEDYAKLCNAIKAGNYKVVRNFAGDQEVLYKKDGQGRFPTHMAVEAGGSNDTEDSFRILTLLIAAAPRTFDGPDSQGISAFDLLMDNRNGFLVMHVIKNIQGQVKVFETLQYILPKIKEICLERIKQGHRLKEDYILLLRMCFGIKVQIQKKSVQQEQEQKLFKLIALYANTKQDMYFKAIEELITSGVNLLATNAEGLTPFLMAANLRLSDLAQLLYIAMSKKFEVTAYTILKDIDKFLETHNQAQYENLILFQHTFIKGLIEGFKKENPEFADYEVQLSYTDEQLKFKVL